MRWFLLVVLCLTGCQGFSLEPDSLTVSGNWINRKSSYSNYGGIAYNEFGDDWGDSIDQVIGSREKTDPYWTLGVAVTFKIGKPDERPEYRPPQPTTRPVWRSPELPDVEIHNYPPPPDEPAKEEDEPPVVRQDHGWLGWIDDCSTETKLFLGAMLTLLCALLFLYRGHLWRLVLAWKGKLVGEKKE